MNIFFVNSMRTDEFGGGEKWMLNAAKGLADSGHTVFMGAKKNSAIIHQAAQKGLQTRIVDIQGDFSPLATLQIARFLKKSNIEVLICNFNKDVRVAGLAGKLSGTPLILARHGQELCQDRWKYKFPLRRLADGIITNTHSIKTVYDNYRYFRKDFVKVIYNGVAIPNHTEVFNFAAAFPNQKIVLAAGRLTRQKGFDILIEAAAILAGRRDDFTVVIAGEGSERRSLEALITARKLKERVVLYGHIADLGPYLRGADQVVLASRYEGMPNIVMEAMAQAKAVIATDVNGVRELMGSEESGVIVPSERPAALAGAVDKLLDRPALAESYGQSGLKRVKQHFSMEMMIQQLETYLLEMLDEKRP